MPDNRGTAFQVPFNKRASTIAHPPKSTKKSSTKTQHKGVVKTTKYK